MNKELKLATSIEINATPDQVWFALTDKELIKQYFFGTETETDWQVGSPIIFSGIWENTRYEEKGFILQIEKEHLLKYSYWSSFWGEATSIDDYSIITYSLTHSGNKTVLSLTQVGFADEASRDHSIGNWNGVLESIKNILEK